jgi:hypothetical protein
MSHWLGSYMLLVINYFVLMILIIPKVRGSGAVTQCSQLQFPCWLFPYIFADIFVLKKVSVILYLCSLHLLIEVYSHS